MLRAVKACGKYVPEEWADAADLTGNENLRGVIMPTGPLVESEKKSLWYNEVCEVVFSPLLVLTSIMLVRRIRCLSDPNEVSRKSHIP